MGGGAPTGCLVVSVVGGRDLALAGHVRQCDNKQRIAPQLIELNLDLAAYAKFL